MRTHALLNASLALQAKPQEFLEAAAVPDRSPQELADRFFPQGVPFPQQRLSDAFPQMMGHREQWIDYNGSFVATDPAALPAGGQRAGREISSDQATLFFLADMGHASAQQAQVFTALEQQVEPHAPTAMAPEAAEAVSAPSAYKAPSFSMIVGGGDWAYPHGPEDNSPHERARLDHTVLNRAARLATQAPFLSVLGNHEYGDQSGAADPQQFMAFAKDKGLEVPGRYYHYEIQAPHWALDLIAVDSSVLAADPDQQHWVAETVAQSVAKEAAEGLPRWRIMISHHPLQSYGYHGNETDYLQTLLAEPLKQCDLFLAGHEHDIQVLRDQPGRLPLSLVCGTSSESRPITAGKETLYHTSAPGYGAIEIGPRQLSLQVLTLDETQVTDQKPALGARPTVASEHTIRRA